MKNAIRKTYTKPSIEVIEVKSFFLVCVCSGIMEEWECTTVPLE